MTDNKPIRICRACGETYPNDPDPRFWTCSHCKDLFCTACFDSGEGVCDGCYEELEIEFGERADVDYTLYGNCGKEYDDPYDGEKVR